MILSRRHLILASGASLMLPGIAVASGEPSFEAVHFDPDAPVLGNPEGDVTLVEYFDYQCPNCKAMHPLLTELVEADGQIRLILKDWPVFGAASAYAAQLALGAVDLGVYAQVSHALMQTPGRLDFDDVADAVETVVSPDEAYASYDAGRERWDPLLARNAAQAEGFGFIGTPSFVIGAEVMGGAQDRATLEAAIRAARG